MWMTYCAMIQSASPQTSTSAARKRELALQWCAHSRLRSDMALITFIVRAMCVKMTLTGTPVVYQWRHVIASTLYPQVIPSSRTLAVCCAGT
mmetsp:Transcript_156516/g.288634  ORF Transcript_156516/g.288634 Transcript_156516/m.288634 type:complete len:92 (+) Transcript_156516:304-579(+)